VQTLSFKPGLGHKKTQLLLFGSFSFAGIGAAGEHRHS
jgi:hypothetical protein